MMPSAERESRRRASPAAGGADSGLVRRRPHSRAAARALGRAAAALERILSRRGRPLVPLRPHRHRQDRGLPPGRRGHPRRGPGRHLPGAGDRPDPAGRRGGAATASAELCAVIHSGLTPRASSPSGGASSAARRASSSARAAPSSRRSATSASSCSTRNTKARTRPVPRRATTPARSPCAAPRPKAPDS